MKLKIVFILVLLSSVCFAQDEKHTAVDYAGSIIEIPEGYTSTTKKDISGNKFRASWFSLPDMGDNDDMSEQLISEFESQLPLTEAKEITFISSGSEFTGKQYVLDNRSYIILGCGIINNQFVFLNVSFIKEPKTNDDLDELMKKFIVFKE